MSASKYHSIRAPNMQAVPLSRFAKDNRQCIGQMFSYVAQQKKFKGTRLGNNATRMFRLPYTETNYIEKKILRVAYVHAIVTFSHYEVIYNVTKDQSFTYPSRAYYHHATTWPQITTNPRIDVVDVRACIFSLDAGANVIFVVPRA